MPFYLGDPGLDSSRDDECPALRRTIGTLESEFDPNGGLCCEVPPLLTVDDCEGLGGVAIGDPGGGSSYSLGCAAVTTQPVGPLLGWLCEEPGGFCGEGGICCGQ